MHRTQTGTNGLFISGNPASGQPSSQIAFDWLNDLQENIVQVLLDAGIELEPGNPNQLAEAIDRLIGGLMGVSLSGGTSSASTVTISGAGLLGGGGDLTADRVLTVLKASVAEARAGLRDDAAVTPLALTSVISSVISQFAFTDANPAAGTRPAVVLRLGPIVVQSFFVRNFAASGPVTVLLPEAFPNNGAAGFVNITNVVGFQQYPTGLFAGWWPYLLHLSQVTGLGPSTVTFRAAGPAVQDFHLLVIGY